MDQKQRLAPSVIGSSGSNLPARRSGCYWLLGVVVGEGVAAPVAGGAGLGSRSASGTFERTFVAAFTNRFRTIDFVTHPGVLLALKSAESPFT
jgi:hypothetical protein